VLPTDEVIRCMKNDFGLDHRLVETVGADSISAPTQYVAERMITAGKSNKEISQILKALFIPSLVTEIISG